MIFTAEIFSLFVGPKKKEREFSLWVEQNFLANGFNHEINLSGNQIYYGFNPYNQHSRAIQFEGINDQLKIEKT